MGPVQFPGMCGCLYHESKCPCPQVYVRDSPSQRLGPSQITRTNNYLRQVGKGLDDLA